MDESQVKKHQQINDKTLQTESYSEFIAKSDFMTPYNLTENYEPGYHERKMQEEDEIHKQYAVQGSETYDELVGGNDSIIQQHSLTHYLEGKNIGEMSKEDKYNALASPENITADKIAENSHSGRKASSRRSKFKEAAKHSKMAEEYRAAYIMNTEVDEGEQTVTFETAVSGLKFLEESLKASRYAAEAKSYSKEHELYRKAKAEVKIRGAQIALIDKLLNSQNVKPEELDKLTDYLNKQKTVIEEKYEKYSKEMLTYGLKLQTEQKQLSKYISEDDRKKLDNKVDTYEKEKFAKKEENIASVLKTIEIHKKELENAKIQNDKALITKCTINLKSDEDNLARCRSELAKYQSTFLDAKEEAYKRGEWINSVVEENLKVKDIAEENGNVKLVELTDNVTEYIRIQKSEFIGSDADYIEALGNYVKCKETIDKHLKNHTDDKTVLAGLYKGLKSREEYLKKSGDRISKDPDLNFCKESDFKDFIIPATYTEYKELPFVKRYEAKK